MDERLRKLERQALLGDKEAQRKLLVEDVRRLGIKPVRSKIVFEEFEQHVNTIRTRLEKPQLSSVYGLFGRYDDFGDFNIKEWQNLSYEPFLDVPTFSNGSNIFDILECPSGVEYGWLRVFKWDTHTMTNIETLFIVVFEPGEAWVREILDLHMDFCDCWDCNADAGAWDYE